jgi:hypothetical protein
VVGVNVILVAADEVTEKDDVVAKDAVNGVNVIDVAALAVVANDAVLGVNVILVAADAVVANEAVGGVNVILVAALAVVAKEALPDNEPVILPNTFIEPVTIIEPVVYIDPVNINVSAFVINEPVIV